MAAGSIFPALALIEGFSSGDWPVREDVIGLVLVTVSFAVLGGYLEWVVVAILRCLQSH
jgi:hypothetical protein